MSDQPISSHSPIVKALSDEGIIPARCFNWTLTVKAGDVVRIRSEVYVTEAEFRRIADLVMAHRESCKQERIVHSDERDRDTIDASDITWKPSE